MKLKRIWELQSPYDVFLLQFFIFFSFFYLWVLASFLYPSDNVNQAFELQLRDVKEIP